MYREQHGEYTYWSLSYVLRYCWAAKETRNTQGGGRGGGNHRWKCILFKGNVNTRARLILNQAKLWLCERSRSDFYLISCFWTATTKGHSLLSHGVSLLSRRDNSWRCVSYSMRAKLSTWCPERSIPLRKKPHIFVSLQNTLFLEM